MYLWKYWRETRVVALISLALVGVLFVLVLKEHPTVSGPQAIGQLSMILPVSLYFQTAPIGLLGWLLGSCGVGRDLGDRTGAYLFTRPRRRAYFVWRDWAFGMAEMLPIVVLLNLALGYQVHRLLAAAGDPLHGSVLLSREPVGLAHVVALTCCAGFLLNGLIFSVTYFSTVLVKHSKGIMLAAVLVLGYLVLGIVVSHYWPAVHLPGLVLPEFALQTMSGIGENLWISIVARAGVILLFPLAAQVLLEKSDL